MLGCLAATPCSDFTDSYVYLSLTQLAITTSQSSTAKSASASIDADADILELSHDFSDFSCFNSHISDELQRLALTPISASAFSRFSFTVVAANAATAALDLQDSNIESLFGSRRPHHQILRRNLSQTRRQRRHEIQSRC